MPELGLSEDVFAGSDSELTAGSAPQESVEPSAVAEAAADTRSAAGDDAHAEAAGRRGMRPK